ncbi:MAG: response regulator [Campylobacterota bacterium]|nr:response regulator [Campylobacterota bacterium]
MNKIAIVDDENHILEMLSTFLEDSYDVTIFSNPLVALQNIQNGGFDLVLCDIMMPEMNGLELLKKLRENHNDTKVIMMTAFDTMDKALEAHKYGANHYIKKPFNSLIEVEQKISDVLNNI